MTIPKYIHYLLGVIYLLFAIWVIYGFFQPNFLFLNEEIHSSYFIKFIIVLIYLVSALLLFAIPFTYYKLIFKSTPVKNIFYIFIIILFFSLVFYVPVSYFYERTLMPNEKFHPYLQLNPPEIPQGIPNNDEFLIVCLGGSTTAWADEKNQKWPKQAEINLNKAIPGHNFRVLNQGKEWYTSQHSLINYEINIRFLKPDLVIIMHSINDFMQNADHSYYSNGEFRRDYGHAMGPFTRLFRIRPLFVQIKHVFNSIWYAKTQEEITTDTFPGLVSMEENLNRLIQLISLDGSSTILQTQPYLYKENMNKAEISSIWMHRANGVGKDKKWSIETARKGMIQYNNCIRRIAEEKNIPLIDLEAKVPKTLEYFTDDCHYKSPAIQIISREVSQTIVDLIKEKELSVSN